VGKEAAVVAIADEGEDDPEISGLGAGAIAYFDSWVWVALTRARKSNTDRLRQCWLDLRLASQSGALQVVLTSGNYLELWNRRSSESRREVAKTMAELSRYATIRAIHEVLDAG